MSGKSWREPVLVVAGLSIMAAAGITLPPWFEMREVQKVVAARLADPDAAQFRNMRKAKFDDVCGEVNGKNRFGAYVGFEPFVAVRLGSGRWLVILDEDMRETIVRRCNT